MFYEEVVKIAEKICIKKNVCMMNGGGSVYGEVIDGNGTDYDRAFREG